MSSEVISHIHRRNVLLSITAFAAFPRATLAREYADLSWEDLLPKDVGPQVTTPRGVLSHSQADLLSQQPVSTGIRTELNDRAVRLPGYIIPLEFDGTKVGSFILVPYVGACIHVPPPPANQIVLVDSDEPYEAEELFEAVYVSGILTGATESTALADVGYHIQASRVEPYT